MIVVHHTCIHKLKNTLISFVKLYFPRKMFFDDGDDDDDFESLPRVRFPRVRYSHWKQDAIFLVLIKVWRTVLLNIEIYKAKNIQSLYSWLLEHGRKIKLLYKQKVKTYFHLYFDIAIAVKRSGNITFWPNVIFNYFTVTWSQTEVVLDVKVGWKGCCSYLSSILLNTTRITRQRLVNC